MKLLAIERAHAGVQAEMSQSLLKNEARRVWELQQTGALREISFHAEEHTAILVLECADVNEAEVLLATLPLVKAGLIHFELIPLRPYDGFSRLFTGETSGDQ